MQRRVTVFADDLVKSDFFLRDGIIKVQTQKLCVML